MRITVDTIIKDSDPIMRQKSVDVPLPMSEEDKQIMNDMLQYVFDSTDEELAEKYNLRPAVGIAAVQIGVLKKMLAIVIDQGEEEEPIVHALVNPKIVSESAQRTYLKMGEGCLSVEEEHEGYVPRAFRITVKGYDMLKDEMVTIKAKGYEAIVLQHEIDHFSGVLFYDHINAMNPFFENEEAKIIE